LCGIGGADNSSRDGFFAGTPLAFGYIRHVQAIYNGGYADEDRLDQSSHRCLAEDGKAESWVFESNPPAWFRRVGVGRADFAKAIGQAVKIEGVVAKNGSLYGYLQKITFADGSSLELANGSDTPR